MSPSNELNLLRCHTGMYSPAVITAARDSTGMNANALAYRCP